MIGSAILAPFLPYVIGGVLVTAVGGGWWLHHAGYRAGVTTERGAWEQEAARLRVVAATEAARRLSDAMRADAAARVASDALATLADTSRKDVDAYYHDRLAVQCLSPERLRAIALADAAAVAAASPAK